MRRGRGFFILAILIFGGLAAYLLLKGPLGPQPTATPVPEGTPGPGISGQVVQIVRATQNIARGSIITDDVVDPYPYPADYVIETMMLDQLLVIGRRARMDIPRGAAITSTMITETAGDLVGTGSDAGIAIPFGYTAIAVPMDRLSGVAYALRDGDKVDVLVTMAFVDIDVDFQTLLPNQTLGFTNSTLDLQTGLVCKDYSITPEGIKCVMPEVPIQGKVVSEPQTRQQVYVFPNEGQRPRLVTQRLVQNATVLHVGSYPFPGEEEAKKAAQPIAVPEQQGVGAPAQQQQQAEEVLRPPDIISLIVTPQDALVINWVVKAGLDVVLTLRAPGDATPTTTNSVTLQYLVDNLFIPVPAKQPYGLQPRVDEPIEPVLPNDQPLPTPTPQR